MFPLQFSKSGTPEVEQAYATHYVDKKEDFKCEDARVKKGVTI